MTKSLTKFVSSPFFGSTVPEKRAKEANFAGALLAWWLLRLGYERRQEMKPSRPYLTDEDIRYEFRIMMRWCRLFRKTAVDWVIIEAARFRDRHPVRSVEPACEG